MEFGHCSEAKQFGAEAIRHEGLRFYQRKASITASKSPSAALIHYHGNGGTACERSYVFKELSSLPIEIVLLEFPGYANDPEEVVPNQKIILSEALRIYDFLKKGDPQKNIFLFGESLGTAVATYVASERKVAGLILEAPFTSIADVAQSHYPFLPVKWMVRSPFPSAEWAIKVSAPVLALRGEKDKTVPPTFTLKQIQNFKNVEALEFKNADHSTIGTVQPEVYWNKIREFIRENLSEQLSDTE